MEPQVGVESRKSTSSPATEESSRYLLVSSARELAHFWRMAVDPVFSFLRRVNSSQSSDAEKGLRRGNRGADGALSARRVVGVCISLEFQPRRRS